MPRLNTRGAATTGYCTTWYDDDRTIRYNVPDGHLVVELSDGTSLYSGAVLSQYAGYRHWCAEIPGGVLFDGTLLPGAALGGYCDPLGPDGSLVVKRRRDSFGPWGFVGGADFGGDCRTVTNYGDGKASWIEGDWIFHTTFPTPYAGTRCYNYRLKGNDFLYQSADTGELVFHGRVVGPAGNYYRPDFLRLGDVWRIVWSSAEGEPTVVVRNLTDADLASFAAYNPVVPAPAPAPAPPPPPPAPEPTPMPYALPPNVLSIMRRYVTRYPVPQMSGPGPSDSAFEDTCRQWCLYLAEQVAHDTGDSSWGVKNAGGGRPQSKDSLSQQTGGKLINFDLLSGVGTGHPTLVEQPSGEDITGQAFMPVLAIDHLGSEPPPPAPPPDDLPVLDPSIAELRAELTTAIDRLNALVADVATLQGLVAKLVAPDLTGYVTKGTVVTVKGEIAAFGFKKTITSSGIL